MKRNLFAITAAAFALARYAQADSDQEYHTRIADSEAASAARAEKDSRSQTPDLAVERTTREGRMLPFTLSPRIGDERVTGRFFGGYDGGHKDGVAEGIAEGRVTRTFAVRAGVSSYDLWGRGTAILGARARLLSEETSGLDLGLGALYEPQSVRGDGQIVGLVSVGRTIGALSSFATVGYGQDVEGDDRVGLASLGAILALSDSFHLGFDSRIRGQLGSDDEKATGLVEPTFDFTAGPMLAYSLGAFDIIAQGGLAGLMLSGPEGAPGEHSSLHLGPLVLMGIGAAL